MKRKQKHQSDIHKRLCGILPSEAAKIGSITTLAGSGAALALFLDMLGEQGLKIPAGIAYHMVLITHMVKNLTSQESEAAEPLDMTDWIDTLNDLDEQSEEHLHRKLVYVLKKIYHEFVEDPNPLTGK